MHASRGEALRVLLISGSQRRKKDCPGRNSKSREFLLRMADSLPKEWVIDVEDLGNVKEKTRIQPCNACVSTSMALCVWPCNCFVKNHLYRPDLLWDLDLYRRLDLADAWAFIAPVNWYGPTTNLKTLFDRLVCANGGNPNSDLIDNKNPEKAIALEHSPEWEKLHKNHLEGRTAAFFCHGDKGGDEIDEQGRPKILEHKEYFNPKDILVDDSRETYAPLVWQCRYSGVEVPDALWTYQAIGEGKKYSDNQKEDLKQSDFTHFDQWVKEFERFVGHKGKVPENEFSVRAFDQAEHLK